MGYNVKQQNYDPNQPQLIDSQIVVKCPFIYVNPSQNGHFSGTHCMFNNKNNHQKVSVFFNTSKYLLV